MHRVLIGTIGYQYLRDYSVGPMLLPRLQAMAWPPGVTVEELNWGPIAVVQNLEAMAEPYDRIVLLAAREQGRAVGTLTLRRWRGGLPEPERIQDRIAEAVTGVISVDNLLVIGEHFGVWPEEVFLVDVEPGPEEAGTTLTPPVEAAMPAILETVRRAALAEAPSLPPMEPMHGHLLGLYHAN